MDPDTLPALGLDDLTDESEAELIARGSAYAREYARVELQPTILLKNIAAVVVAIRRQHDDWLGTTSAYRQVVADMYRQAGIPADSKDRLQSAVRWHVGNLLRQTLTARQVERLGLLPTSPLERQQDSRATNAALVVAATVSRDASSSTPRKKRGKRGQDVALSDEAEHAGSPVKATADHIRLATVAGNIVGQMDTDVITHHMTDGQRQALDDKLASISRTVTALRRHTRKPRSKA
ncbi:hypothetical protein [Streptomyces albipurpureus]|uniref:Uncharacterized protein n=1 Tax=Streptomyces albipurpureus TaxID=2897419 RepID=A0ABT0UTC9_9ACTN|nr:hypothetical protein [Streptomyces sp. CWNU-1]MCM2391725.1 hypothetical protein [Streptomyces sp. CWNU-1]